MGGSGDGLPELQIEQVALIAKLKALRKLLVEFQGKEKNEETIEDRSYVSDKEDITLQNQ